MFFYFFVNSMIRCLIISQMLDIIAGQTFCPAGMVYQCSAPACLATCTEPNAANECPYANKDACVCPAGQVLNNGTCTSSCPVGCLDSNSQLRQVGKCICHYMKSTVDFQKSLSTDLKELSLSNIDLLCAHTLLFKVQPMTQCLSTSGVFETTCSRRESGLQIEYVLHMRVA
jgi:hypothetical protein